MSFFMYFETVCAETPTPFAMSYCGIPLAAMHSLSRLWISFSSMIFPLKANFFAFP